MDAPQKDDKEDQQAPKSPAVGWTGMIEQQYRRIKENAEAYPYVWGSYIVVYGGFGLWFAYRFRKLRRTEDRVRALQDRLRFVELLRIVTLSPHFSLPLTKIIGTVAVVHHTSQNQVEHLGLPPAEDGNVFCQTSCWTKPPRDLQDSGKGGSHRCVVSSGDGIYGRAVGWNVQGH
ncbi:hypothetical protein RHSIM_Rhsim10G0172600 [Rhododendron simsii]|uniref:Uncharacterized protein n=1 Tax=Rhododendron simsii TaxID=118357 RepID=A0A834LDI2_RHOSS|nr:hypothetical protein RHSIM_Rhsim10G0172600 [Rhododendron simsii]